MPKFWFARWDNTIWASVFDRTLPSSRQWVVKRQAGLGDNLDQPSPKDGVRLYTAHAVILFPMTTSETGAKARIEGLANAVDGAEMSNDHIEPRCERATPDPVASRPTRPVR